MSLPVHPKTWTVPAYEPSSAVTNSLTSLTNIGMLIENSVSIVGSLTLNICSKTQVACTNCMCNVQRYDDTYS